MGFLQLSMALLFVHCGVNVSISVMNVDHDDPPPPAADNVVVDASHLQMALLCLPAKKSGIQSLFRNTPEHTQQYVVVILCMLCPCFVHVLLCAAYFLQFPRGRGKRHFGPFWPCSVKLEVWVWVWVGPLCGDYPLPLLGRVAIGCLSGSARLEGWSHRCPRDRRVKLPYGGPCLPPPPLPSPRGTAGRACAVRSVSVLRGVDSVRVAARTERWDTVARVYSSRVCIGR